MIEYQFWEYPIYTKYSRTYTNAVDVLITVGGTYTSLSSVGYSFTILFAYNLMMSSLIRKLYFFRPKFPGEIRE